MDREEERRALDAYVRARLLREEQAHGRGYRVDVAKRSGLSKGTISNIMNAGAGVGFDVALAIGRAWGMTPTEMIDAALGEEGAAVTLPNLAAALAFLASRGPVPPSAVAAARRIGAASRDFSVEAWMLLLRDLSEELPSAAAGGTGGPRK